MVSVGERLGLLPRADIEVVGEDGDLTITRTSIFTRKRNTMRLPVTRAQLARHGCGGLVQEVFPDLSADQREFLISGATPEEWNSTGATPEEWNSTFGGDT